MPAETIDDLATAVLAGAVGHHTAIQQAALKDNQIYRQRMNAVADAQARQYGAQLPQTGPEEDVNVYTNSPVTNPTQVIRVPSSSTAAWILGIVCAVLSTLLLVTLALLFETKSVTPTPPTPPAPANGGWEIDPSVRDQ